MQKTLEMNIFDDMVRVTGLKKYYVKRKEGILKKPAVVKAVDDVSFSIPEGQTLGMIGESGSGKTSIARCLLRIVEPDSGEIKIAGTDINKLRGEKLRKFRKNMQIVFQDPYSSLNPKMTVGKIITEPLRVHSSMNQEDFQRRLAELLEIVGISPLHADRYPGEFSGGQRQRIGIARAIALNPKFIILDEPVSSLDMSIQGQILNLLSDLQKQLNLTFLFISHDLAVVEYISDRIAVIYLGRIVEENSGQDLYRNPLHPYTQSLIKSIPERKPVKQGFDALGGEIPSPENPPNGCHFYPRCKKALSICNEEYPPEKIIGQARVSCFLY